MTKGCFPPFRVKVRDLLKEIVEVGALTDEIKVKIENSILEFKKIFLQNA